MPSDDASYTVPPELDGKPLDGVLRSLAGGSWGEARGRIESGKVSVDGLQVKNGLHRVQAGQTIAVAMRAPKPKTAERLSSSAIAFVDPHVVVVRKPAGVSTIPYEPGERGTLDQLVAALLHHKEGRGGPPATLGVVQRLDKETSGLLVFARSFGAKKALGHQLREHTMLRRYLAVVHGVLDRSMTYSTHIVPDRGDGLRGSTKFGNRGQLAVTHVEPVEPLRGATLLACRLETGRTHQIRIHLSEDGHPLVGERVYVRRWEGEQIESPRIMLHAAELGFVHPVHGTEMRFEEPMPADMTALLERLRRR